MSEESNEGQKAFDDLWSGAFLPGSPDAPELHFKHIEGVAFVPETPPPLHAIDNPDPVTEKQAISGLFFPDDFMQTESWWCLHSSRVRAMLVRAAAGDDPDVVMMEEYGNSLTWSPGGD